jgi:hypothetical protein
VRSSATIRNLLAQASNETDSESASSLSSEESETDEIVTHASIPADRLQEDLARIVEYDQTIKRLRREQKEKNMSLETIHSEVTQEVYGAVMDYLAQSLKRPVESFVVDWDEQFKTNGTMLESEDKLIVSPALLRQIVIDCYSLQDETRS